MTETSRAERVERDPVVYAAGGFVALVAVLSSYATLVHLAELAGWDYVLVTAPGGFRIWASHLWAASIDAYGLCALRVWLRSGLTEDTRRWAQRDAAGALAVSVVGNVAEHLLSAAGVTRLGGDIWSPGLLGVVAVAVVAPVQVARIGHLLILLGRDRAVPKPGPLVLAVDEAQAFLLQQRAEAAERDRTHEDGQQIRDELAAVDPLLPVAREVAHLHYEAKGRAISRAALIIALRDRGQGIGTNRATELLAQLRTAV